MMKTLMNHCTAAGLCSALLMPIAGVSNSAIADDHHHHHDAVPTCEIYWPPHIDRGAYEPIPWPGGIVPFEFDANVNATNQTRTLNAMAAIEAVANIDFVPRDGEANYIHVQDDTVNQSAVGMVGGQQILRMTSWGSTGDGGVNFIIVHELLHALGFYHEQSRADRATYVVINLDNIQDAAEGNFDIEAGASLTATPYDFDSVLHYDKCAFSDCCPPGFTCDCPDNCLAIEAIAPYEDQQDLMGQRTRLSCLDIAGLREVYNGSAGEDCNNNGTPDQCDIEFGDSPDCDMNGIPDECESTDPDGDGVYNNCDNCPDTANPEQEDCDMDGIGDVCAVADGLVDDCNGNGIPDTCDIDPTDPDGNGVYSLDCQPNGIPDECDIDPNDPDGNGMVSPDCQPNGVPDECDIADGTSEDCNNNDVPDECDIATGFSEDCNTDGIPDECQLGNCLNQYPNHVNASVADLDCAICGPDVQVDAVSFDLEAGSSVLGFRWWGTYGFTDDAAIHDRFYIEIRPDNGGVPGAAVSYMEGPFEAELKLDSGVNLGTSRVFEYTHWIAGAAALAPGKWWVILYNDTSQTTDTWFWSWADNDPVHSESADGQFSTVGPDGPWSPLNLDLALQVYCGTYLDNDCNSNGIPDDCELDADDCNNNGILDECETKPDGDPSVAVEQDLCDNAMLACPGFDYDGTNVGATNSDGVFFCGLYYGLQDVYYRYRPKYDGLTFVRVEGPPQYWLYAVYDDCPGAGGVEIQCNEQDHFNVTFDAEAGHTYYIRIASWGLNPPGSFEMNIVGPPCALADNDLNCNMIPDECECLADVNNDNTVDMLDFVAAWMAYGPCSCPEDVNGDGVVNDTDLAIILNNQGPCQVFPFNQKDVHHGGPATVIQPNTKPARRP